MKVLGSRRVKVSEISLGDDSGWRPVAASRVKELTEEITSGQWNKTTLAYPSLLVDERGQGPWVGNLLRDCKVTKIAFMEPQHTFCIPVAISSTEWVG